VTLLTKSQTIVPAHAVSSQQRFTTADLPNGTIEVWFKKFIPLLRQHVGTLVNPWSPPDLLSDVQDLWTQVFPNCPKTLEATNEPVFSLVCTFYFYVLTSE
jgi:hypothetical protein